MYKITQNQRNKKIQPHFSIFSLLSDSYYNTTVKPTPFYFEG